jgi:hypothetical protein
MHEPWRLIAIDRFPEGTGVLSVLEIDKHVPFETRRIFWVSGVPDTSIERGAHAHEALQQVLFCAKGSCEIELETREGRRAKFTLEERGPALFLDGPVWRTMRGFSSDCAMMVLCDREYSRDRVIRNRAEFLAT